VQTLPSTLRNHVFNNLNYTQSEQIACGTNEGYNEVWWFYPTANSEVNNAYVVYNFVDKIWYYGELDRTAWLDSPLRQFPQATTSINPLTEPISYLYNHESGLDADGVPMDSYIQSSDFDIKDGETFMLIRRIIPDVNFSSSTAASPEVMLTMRPRNWPGSDFTNDAADSQRVIETNIGAYTNQVFIRARARQMALKISSDTLGVQWQLGNPRLDAREDGKR
jgi:hypothetical protein